MVLPHDVHFLVEDVVIDGCRCVVDAAVRVHYFMPGVFKYVSIFAQAEFELLEGSLPALYLHWEAKTRATGSFIDYFSGRIPHTALGENR